MEFLEEAYADESEPQFLVIYGRRRVGKTELMKKFIEGKPHIYFLADERGDKSNLKEIQKLFSYYLEDNLFAKAEISDWAELFGEAVKRKGNEKLIIAIDEFPYLLKSNKGMASIFQKIWDEILPKKNVFLILTGSSISMMEKNVLGAKSPLYGRRTGQWRLKPLKLKHLHCFLPKYSLEDLIKTYAITDGIPQYLKKINPSLSFDENLKANVLKSGKFLHEETEILLREELREPSNYFNILKAISFGRNRFGEIASLTELDKSMVSKYLENLIKIHVIKKEFPATQKKETRNAHYIFCDNYFNFWFRFVYPNKSLIEEGRQKFLLTQISSDLNQYFSTIFEKTGQEALIETNKKQSPPFTFTKIGRWWHKDKEIDIVALNEKTKKILFCECKWKKNVNAEKILADLKEKSQFVQWNNEKRKEHFAVFAKSFKKKTKPKEKNVHLFDLNDLEKAFRK